MPGGGDDAIFQGIAEHEHDKVLADSKAERKKGIDVPDITVGEADVADGDLIYPTDEERETLPREPGALSILTFSIGLIELAERFGYYGCQAIFTNFLQYPLPENSRTGAGGNSALGQSGALGKGQQVSTGVTTFFSFYVYLTPLLGAYIADGYLGRYKTISLAVGIAIVGHIILVVSAVPGVISNPNGSLACFIVAILIFGLGTGFFKSNISPLIAEQYTSERLTIKINKKGKRVIQDPALTASRVFNYFYLLINVGALIGQIGMAYTERFVGFWLAFLLPTIVFLLCPLILLWGKNRYRKIPPQGSVLPDAFRAWRMAGKGAWSWNPIRTWHNWDFSKAYPSRYAAEDRPKWMSRVPNDVWVDEVKRGFNACAVFVYMPLWWLTYNQINNNLTSQAATLTYGNIPNDVINNLDPFALIIFIPIFDIVIYPGLRKAGINFSPLKRMAAGFFVGALAMMCAAIVQWKIYTTSVCGYSAADCPQGSPISVWVQTPSYVLIAFSEIFASITGLEYAFTKAPKNMRSLVTAVWLLTTAVANALSEAFLPLVADPNLIWNYSVAGVLSFIGGCAFWISFRHLDKQERFLNEIADRAAAHGEISAEEAEGRRIPSEKKEGRSAPGI